jgi:hypothetical protein
MINVHNCKTHFRKTGSAVLMGLWIFDKLTGGTQDMKAENYCTETQKFQVRKFSGASIVPSLEDRSAVAMFIFLIAGN